MRVAVDPSDPGYTPYHPFFEVYLNGVQQRLAVAADDGLGEVIVYQTDLKGRLMLGERGALRETKRGYVEIIDRRPDFLKS